MASFFTLFYTFMDAVVWILGLVFMVSVLHRYHRFADNNQFVMGAVFSIGVILSMTDPITLPHGSGIYDMRYLLIGIATGMFGPIAGLTTLAVALSYRIYIGGAGVDSAIIGAFVVYAACWGYQAFVAGRDLPAALKSLILSLCISAQLSAFLAVPAEMVWSLMAVLGPYMVVSSFLGTFMLKHLLSGELSFLSRAQALKIEANTDHLTGLLNRRGLELLYPELIQDNRSNRGQALIYFDVDRFKATNDTFGHKVGDDVLCHVVNHVAASLRQNDTFVRLGGDEFAVILPEIEAHEAEAIAERCRRVVAETPLDLSEDEEVIRTSISVGAVWSAAPAAVPEMLERADGALYTAKAKGRNVVVFLKGIRDSLDPLGVSVSVEAASL